MEDISCTTPASFGSTIAGTCDEMKPQPLGAMTILTGFLTKLLSGLDKQVTTLFVYD